MRLSSRGLAQLFSGSRASYRRAFVALSSALFFLMTMPNDVTLMRETDSANPQQLHIDNGCSRRSIESAASFSVWPFQPLMAHAAWPFPPSTMLHPSAWSGAHLIEDTIAFVGGVYNAARNDNGLVTVSNVVVVFSPSEGTWVQTLLLPDRICGTSFSFQSTVITTEDPATALYLSAIFFTYAASFIESSTIGNHQSVWIYAAASASNKYPFTAQCDGVLIRARMEATFVDDGYFMYVLGGVDPVKRTPIATFEYRVKCCRLNEDCAGMTNRTDAAMWRQVALPKGIKSIRRGSAKAFPSTGNRTFILFGGVEADEALYPGCTNAVVRMRFTEAKGLEVFECTNAGSQSYANATSVERSFDTIFGRGGSGDTLFEYRANGGYVQYTPDTTVLPGSSLLMVSGSLVTMGGYTFMPTYNDSYGLNSSNAYLYSTMSFASSVAYDSLPSATTFNVFYLPPVLPVESVVGTLVCQSSSVVCNSYLEGLVLSTSIACDPPYSRLDRTLMIDRNGSQVDIIIGPTEFYLNQMVSVCVAIPSCLDPQISYDRHYAGCHVQQGVRENCLLTGFCLVQGQGAYANMKMCCPDRLGPTFLQPLLPHSYFVSGAAPNTTTPAPSPTVVPVLEPVDQSLAAGLALLLERQPSLFTALMVGVSLLFAFGAMVAALIVQLCRLQKRAAARKDERRGGKKRRPASASASGQHRQGRKGVPCSPLLEPIGYVPVGGSAMGSSLGTINGCADDSSQLPSTTSDRPSARHRGAMAGSAAPPPKAPSSVRADAPPPLQQPAVTVGPALLLLPPAASSGAERVVAHESSPTDTPSNDSTALAPPSTACISAPLTVATTEGADSGSVDGSSGAPATTVATTGDDVSTQYTATSRSPSTAVTGGGGGLTGGGAASSTAGGCGFASHDDASTTTAACNILGKYTITDRLHCSRDRRTHVFRGYATASLQNVAAAAGVGGKVMDGGAAAGSAPQQQEGPAIPQSAVPPPAPSTYYALKVVLCHTEEDRLEATAEYGRLKRYQQHAGIVKVLDYFIQWPDENKYQGVVDKRAAAASVSSAGGGRGSFASPSLPPARGGGGSTTASSAIDIALLLRGCPCFVCIVMYHYKAGDLHSYLRLYPEPMVPEAAAVKMVAQLANTLGYLHQLHPMVAHRNLRTENILVDVRKNRVVLADFGRAADVVGVAAAVGGAPSSSSSASPVAAAAAAGNPHQTLLPASLVGAGASPSSSPLMAGTNTAANAANSTTAGTATGNIDSLLLSTALSVSSSMASPSSGGANANGGGTGEPGGLLTSPVASHALGAVTARAKEDDILSLGLVAYTIATRKSMRSAMVDYNQCLLDMHAMVGAKGGRRRGMAAAVSSLGGEPALQGSSSFTPDALLSPPSSALAFPQAVRTSSPTGSSGDIGAGGGAAAAAVAGSAAHSPLSTPTDGGLLLPGTSSDGPPLSLGGGGASSPPPLSSAALYASAFAPMRGNMRHYSPLFVDMVLAMLSPSYASRPDAQEVIRMCLDACPRFADAKFSETY